jgi:EAL domain-containing protein (putative c-di-GMP-specific phosphodiesterase class I)
MWMAYQPIVSIGRHRSVAYEALMRTSEPALPNPGAVIDAAQRLDRLNDLGLRVRSLVAASLPDAPHDALVFVNLHARDLLDPELSSESAPLSSFARRVVLEITERAALDNVTDYEARVKLLRDLGFRIAIDDMGAGYAGLTSFATLEPEFVKLDMSLIRGIHTSDVRQKLVASMISLCGEMDKGIIAEGIEVADERDQLSALGCDWMQGYLFAKPQRPFPTATWQ